jgi:hypothetical protein
MKKDARGEVGEEDHVIVLESNKRQDIEELANAAPEVWRL